MGTNVYNALLQPVRSMQDYADQYAEADARKQAMGMNALMMQEKQMSFADRQRQMAEQNAIRDAWTSVPEGASPEDRIGAIEKLGTQSAFAQADALRKQALDRQKTAGEVANKNEETAAKAIARYRGALDYIDTPNGAVRWLQAQYADPVLSEYMNRLGPLHEAAQRIPTDPQGFQQWREQAAMGMEKHMEMQGKQRDYKLKANNELIGADGTVNQPLLNAKRQIATAGATTINTGQKGLDNELKIKNDFRQEPIYKAHQEMQSAYGQISEALKKANPVGDLAAATKIMKLLDPGSVVRESELGMAMAANGMLDRLTNYGSMLISGEKLTPKQRAEFQQLADTLYGQSVNLYNAKHGEYSQLAGKYGIDPKSTLGAPISAAKSGGKTVVRTGTDASGKKVVQYSDGSIEHAEH